MAGSDGCASGPDRRLSEPDGGWSDSPMFGCRALLLTWRMWTSLIMESELWERTMSEPIQNMSWMTFIDGDLGQALKRRCPAHTLGPKMDTQKVGILTGAWTCVVSDA